MSIGIETKVEMGATRVYGCPIATYTVDGAEGCGIVEAMAFGVLKQSMAIEALTTAVGRVVKLRQQKASEIADAVATVAEAIGSMEQDSSSPSKLSSISTVKLKQANDIFKKYGILEMPLDKEAEQVAYADAYRKQTEVQLVLDTANNDLQQNLNHLSGLVTKRDNAFAVASKVVDKVNRTTKGTIRAVGA